MDGECCLLLDKKTKISDQPEDFKTLSVENIHLIAVEHKKIVQTFVGIISID